MEHTANTSKTKSGTKRLSEKKITIFIEEYVRTLNATKSAIKAGYSEHGARQRGYELLHRPEINQRIQAALDQRIADCKVDRDFVLQHMKDLALDSDVPPKDRVKALDLLGRYCQLWSGKENKSLPDKLVVTLRDSSENAQ